VRQSVAGNETLTKEKESAWRDFLHSFTFGGGMHFSQTSYELAGPGRITTQATDRRPPDELSIS